MPPQAFWRAKPFVEPLDLNSRTDRHEVFAYAAEPRSDALGTTGVNGVFASTGTMAQTQIDLANAFPLGYQFTPRQWDHSRQFNESAAANSYYWNMMMTKIGLDPWYDRAQL